MILFWLSILNMYNACSVLVVCGKLLDGFLSPWQKELTTALQENAFLRQNNLAATSFALLLALYFLFLHYTSSIFKSNEQEHNYWPDVPKKKISVFMSVELSNFCCSECQHTRKVCIFLFQAITLQNFPSFLDLKTNWLYKTVKNHSTWGPGKVGKSRDDICGKGAVGLEPFKMLVPYPLLASFQFAILHFSTFSK